MSGRLDKEAGFQLAGGPGHRRSIGVIELIQNIVELDLKIYIFCCLVLEVAVKDKRGGYDKGLAICEFHKLFAEIA